MKKKPPGLYANIQAKRARGEKMRKPGEEGAPSASDFKNAAKTAKKKKGAKRQDPGYKMYDKDGCKKCSGDKKDMVGRKSGYADGYGKKCDSIAAEFNAVMDTEAREDKPCGASYIPQNAKCSKGAGQAKRSIAKGPVREVLGVKQSQYGLKTQAFGKPYGKTLTNKQVRQVERGMLVEKQRTGKSVKVTEAQAGALASTRGTNTRKYVENKAKGAKRETLRAWGKAGKVTTDPLTFAYGRVARRELLNRNVRNFAAAGLYGVAAGAALSRRRVS